MKLDPNGMCDKKAVSTFWMCIHDGVAHPLLVLTFYARWAVKFHDWTSFKAWPDDVGTTRLERKG